MASRPQSRNSCRGQDWEEEEEEGEEEKDEVFLPPSLLGRRAVDCYDMI